MRAVSARVCALPGKAFVKRGGKFEPFSLKKKHCGKMVDMIDIGRRGNTYAVVAVRGLQIAVPIKRFAAHNAAGKGRR